MSFKWNVFAKRSLIIGLLLVLCVLSTFVDTAKPASAATVSQHPTATTCFGGAAPFNNVTILDTTFGPFFTTSRCNDINLRFTQPAPAVFVDVCWTRHNFCRSRDFGLTLINDSDTSWHVIASDVLDGTEFTVVLHSPSGTPFPVSVAIAF